MRDTDIKTKKRHNFIRKGGEYDGDAFAVKGVGPPAGRCQLQVGGLRFLIKAKINGGHVFANRR
jgi:hypothetical protein